MRGRSQRKMIVYGLAIALLVTTVAYAVLQTTLNIGGTVNRKGGSWNIHFENVANVVKGGDATITTPTISNAGANLTFSASLAVPKDSISFTVNVVNSGTIDAMLSQVVLTGQSEAAANDVTYTATYADGTPINVNDELKSNQTKTLKISAVYNDVESVSAEEVTLDLGLTLIYVQADGAGSGSTEEQPPYGPTVGDTSIASAPDLYNNSLTPIVYDETASTWKVADTSTTWYNYSDQQWANAVILNSDVTKDVGDTVNIETEVKATYVWIPRYEYRIVGQYGTHTDGTAGTQETPGEIEVNFIPYTQTTATSGYHIHPAFTFGDAEESGIWVGKFAVTGDTTTPTIIPNNIALTEGNISAKFTTSQKFATYLSNASGIDAHMMKNSEWGAVAYLSQSRYGKYGNPDYTGIYKEVYANNSYNGYTGRSLGNLITDNVYGNSSSGGTYRYDDYIHKVFVGISTDNGYDEEIYETVGGDGAGASTTGTIYGVYDMSGVVTSVMAIYALEGHVGETYIPLGSWSEIDADGDAYINRTGFENGWFTNETNKKYYDAYTGDLDCRDGWCYDIDVSTACNGGICYGHALSETKGWYNDVDYNLSATSIFMNRGSYYTETTSLSGLYAYSKADGTGHYSFRSVLARS